MNCSERSVIPTHPSTRWKRAVSILFLSLLIVFGSWLRFSHLGADSLWIDEGYTITAAVAIQHHGLPLLSSGTFYSGWLTPNYLTAGSMLLFGFDPFSPWSARVPAALFGVALIPLIFICARSLFSHTGIAYAAAILTTFSQWNIAWSGQARGYTALAICITVLTWCAWKYIRTKQGRYAIGSVIASIFAWSTNLITFFTVPALALFALADAIVRTTLVQRIGLVRLGIVLLFLVLAVVVGLEVAVRMTSLSAEGFPSQYLAFLVQEQTLFLVGAVVAGVLALFDRARIRAVLFVLSMLLIPTLLISTYSPVIQTRYLFPFFPLSLILLSYVVFRCVDLIGCKLSEVTRAAVAFGVIVLLAFPYLQFAPKPRTLEYDSPQPDFATAFSIVRESRSSNDLILSPYAHLHALYLGEKGLWIPISLTGKQFEMRRAQQQGTDWYVGAPMIQDGAELEHILSHSSGFIVFDRMAQIRLPDIYTIITTHPRVQERYRSGAGLDELHLYQFGAYSEL